MQFKEIEYKFWAGDLTKESFHQKVMSITRQTVEPKYVVSCDDYYTHKEMPSGSFLRYRKGEGQKELTIKVKEHGNVIRKELNLDINHNDDSLVVQFIILSGYSKVRSVMKEAWIFNTDQCDISYYTLSTGDSFIEIEAKEFYTIEDGLRIINDWKERLDLDKLKREERSLFEIFQSTESLSDEVELA